MELTKEEICAAVKVCAALAEAIRELGSVPEGVLYANVMGHMSIDAFSGAVKILIGTRLVSRDCNVLVWCGPS